MVQMGSIHETDTRGLLQHQVAAVATEFGPNSKGANNSLLSANTTNTTDGSDMNDFVIINENSIYGRRRQSIEERNEWKRLNDCPDNDDDITLYPFAHQVGGHTQLLTLDKGTVCKPLVPRELLFYLNVPEALVKFVPSYKGVVQVGEMSPDNYQPVVHQPLRSRKSPFSMTRSSAAKTTNSLNNTNNIDNNVINNNSSGNTNNTNNSCNINTTSQQQQQTTAISNNNNNNYSNNGSNTSNNNGTLRLTRNKSSDETTCTPFELRVQLRPFSDEKILKKNLSQDNLLQADYISRPNEKYLLLLENVASKYQLPCILDLKMGTRQHGDDASEEKRHRQIAKCQASTSASLGVRLCGMQVYKVDYGGYLWYDKYYGRKMNEDGLKQALREYFRNGTHLDGGIIDEIIKRLKGLHESILKSPSFRFYGTSLLIIHESCQAAARNLNGCPPVDVRLIDFAHTICDFTAGSTGGRASSSPSILKSASADHLDLLSASCSVKPSIDKIDETNEQQNQQVSQQIRRDIVSSIGHQTDATNFPQNDSQLTNLQDHNAIEMATLQKQELENLNPEITNSEIKPIDQNSLIFNNSAPDGQQPQQDNENASQLQQKQQHNMTMTTTTILGEFTRQQTTTGASKTTTTPAVTLTSLPTNVRKISRHSMGPDKGLLFGLENLMRLLEDLKSETIIIDHF